MGFLEKSSDQDVKRLLELFPASRLKIQWPDLKGTKEEICFVVANQRKSDEVKQFLYENLSCCRQHIYVFSHSTPLNSLPNFAIPDGEDIYRIKESNHVNVFYLIRLQYSVVLREPLEETTLEFLWPVRFDFTENHLIVRFVILERNIGTYFSGRPCYMERRSTDEKTVLQIIRDEAQDTFHPTDLHKGVKQLWDDGFMDSPKAQYKKTISTASEAMDEERGIKEHNPEVYEILTDSVLLNTLFVIPQKDGFSVSGFSMEPAKGYINFPRYTENIGDTDHVVSEILRHN